MSAQEDETSELHELRQRLRELEAENAKLQATRDSSDSGHTHRFSWRSVASAVLIIVATLLVPLATVAGWAKTQLVDEQVFVETLAPLAQHPAVQAEIIQQTSTVIENELQIEALVDSAFDGLISLDLPRGAEAALGLLRGPAIDGAHSLVNSAVTELVRSEAFADTWKMVLTASHRALVVAASGSTAEGQITIGSDGAIVLHLGPVIADVKDRLIAQGIDLARQIPEVNATITLAQNDALGYVGPIYRSAVTLGWVLPFVSLGLFLAGIAVARNRRVGVVTTGIGLVLGAGLTLLAILSAGTYLTSQAGYLGVAPPAVEAVFGFIAARMVGTSVTLVLLGALVVVLAWLTGASAPANALRGVVQSGNSKLAASLYARGFDGGAAGRWLLAQRSLTRALLIILVVLAVVFLPLSTAAVVWTAILALFIWWMIALLESVASCAAECPGIVDDLE